RLAALPDLAPARIALLGQMLDGLQKYLNRLGDGSAETGPRARELAGSLASVAETIYRKAIDPAAAPHPRTYRAYAEHLLLADQRDRCLEVVAQGLRLPAAAQGPWMSTAMQLRELGIKAALVDPQDPRRYEKAAPLIQAMVSTSDPSF